jgi:hypothetical protein
MYILIGRFVDLGLPPLGQRHGSTTEVLVGGHKEAILLEQHVNPTLKDLPLREPTSSMVWTTFDAGLPDMFFDKAEQQVREAIDRMVSRGYCHNDLDWRHVGRLRQHRQQRVIFFDLVNVSRVDTYLPEAVTAAKTKMLQALGLGD